jgi:seryl-tRNA synthetase
LKTTVALLSLALLCAAPLLAGGCFKGCAEKADLDVIPGMKDSGIPDVKAVKEHQAEIERLSKEIQQLSVEAAKIAADPSLSPEEKERRIKEIEKELEVKSQRMEELAEDIANKEIR